MRWKKMFSQRVLFQKEALERLKREYALVDMHVHTKYSHDCQTPINTLLKAAKKIGVGFAVTDHLGAKGAVEAAKSKDILVIPGIELNARENREVILYFYSARDLLDYHEKYIKNTRHILKQPRSALRRSVITVKSGLGMSELLERSTGYACLRCIPHPYTYPPRSSHRFFSIKKDLLGHIDAVEVINSSVRTFMNKRAALWAMKKEKAFTAGSDAHNVRELGKAVVACKADSVESFLDSVKKRENMIIGAENTASAALKNLLEMNRFKRHKEW